MQWWRVTWRHTNTHSSICYNRIGAHCQNLLWFDSINHYLSACILRYFVFIQFFRWMWFSCVTINQFIIENWFIFLFALCPIQTDSELLFSISASIVYAKFMGRCWHNQKQRDKKDRIRTSLFEALQFSALYNVLVAFHWTQYPPQRLNSNLTPRQLNDWNADLGEFRICYSSRHFLIHFNFLVEHFPVNINIQPKMVNANLHCIICSSAKVRLPLSHIFEYLPMKMHGI